MVGINFCYNMWPLSPNYYCVYRLAFSVVFESSNLKWGIVLFHFILGMQKTILLREGEKLTNFVRGSGLLTWMCCLPKQDCVRAVQGLAHYCGARRNLQFCYICFWITMQNSILLFHVHLCICVHSPDAIPQLTLYLSWVGYQSSFTAYKQTDPEKEWTPNYML